MTQHGHPSLLETIQLRAAQDDALRALTMDDSARDASASDSNSKYASW
jgi:hypothetical protein